MTKHRIELLDGFRAIAILCVVLYHFTDRGPTIFPYGNFYRHIFGFGYFGVEFFFMISGFVISYTLAHTEGLLSFYKNRFSRLFPPMLLCSVITFIVFFFLDNNNLSGDAHNVKNFLPSLTFTNPSIWASLTGRDFHWLNGSYWSLWPEIQFYIISSALYFLSKKHFLRNMLVAGIVIIFIKYIPIYFLNSHAQYLQLHGGIAFFRAWRTGDEIFNITFFMGWFLPGVLFYHLYKGFRFNKQVFIGVCSLIVIFCLWRCISLFFANSLYTMLISSIFTLALFLLMIYRKRYLIFLESPFLTRIGVISYTIYLIHEDIGVLLINKYGKYLGDWSFLSPFIITIMAIGFAELSYRFYEKKAAVFLKQLFSKRNSIASSAQ
jgi:peptidoglycan/LPS O-acetylase OafA/YrhL